MNPSAIYLCKPSRWKYFHWPKGMDERLYAGAFELVCDCQRQPVRVLADVPARGYSLVVVRMDARKFTTNGKDTVGVAVGICEKCQAAHWTTNDLEKLIEFCENYKP